MFVTLFALLAPAASAIAAPAVSVAVLSLGSGGVDEELRKAAGGLDGFNVQSKASTVEAVAAWKALRTSCKTETAPCAAKIGALASVNLVITGSVAKDTAKLILVDIATGNEVRAVSLPIPAKKNAAARSLALRLLAVRLLAPERERGSIEVRVAQAGASIVVDQGAPVTAPAPPFSVAPGTHDVFIALTGYESVTQKVDVAFEGHAAVDVTLVRSASATSAADAKAGAGEAKTGVDAKDAKKVRRIAVYKLEAAGVDARAVTVITDSVVAELRKLEKTTVVGMDEIKAMLDLEAQKQIAGCGDASCIAEISEALGVDAVVIGNVAVVGDGISFGLKHIDQRSAQTLGQATRRIDGTDPADVLAAIGPEVQELFPDVPLKPGATRGVASEVALRIHPPPLKPWVFWSLGGATAVALGTGVAFTAWNASAFATADEKSKASAAGPPVPRGEINHDIADVRTSFVGLVVAYGATAVVGAATGVSSLFVDWDGAGDAE